ARRTGARPLRAHGRHGAVRLGHLPAPAVRCRRARGARAPRAAAGARHAPAPRRPALGDDRHDAGGPRRRLPGLRRARRRLPRALPRRSRPGRPRPIVRAVIFDCDGVLVDSEPISNRVLAGLLTEIGLPMTPEESVEAFMGRSWKTVEAHAQAALGRPLPDGFRRRYLDAMFA